MSEPRRLRVLMLTATLGYGGAESSFIRLANFLALRMDVTLALMRNDSYGKNVYGERIAGDRLPIIVLDKSEIQSKNIFLKALKWWRMYRNLLKIKRNHDATISFLSGPNFLNSLTVSAGGTVVSERGSKLHHVGISKLRKLLWLKAIDPLTYHLADYIIPVSKGYSEEVLSIALKRDAHKIIPIEGMICADEMLSNSEELADDDIVKFCNSPTAVFCGRLDRGKGIDLLIPIFANLWRKNQHYRLLIIGDGPMRDKLLNICEQENLPTTTTGNINATVFFAGYRQNPIRHFRLCKVYCFPSLHEGLPNALIEGIASGIPVLSSDCPWGPRAILSGKEYNDSMNKIIPPANLIHGTLLPLPDNPKGADVWQEALEFEFQSQRKRRDISERYAAIKKYDVSNTGMVWLGIIKSLAVDSRVSE